ncbi:ParB-like nuclease domain-containing protein [Collimonas sp. OK307]|uniref:ParB N-terminal domain-containing protein n=1 Tax=Collimonas sp. OK307 TaxID=1801620 RepID=UPI0008F17947|nr:ParB N-terminal domain-containing protein [Collimonas sp. OK307]SFI14874.1 ParB-like nuclease domain-containing protein [Collimonas sp. OK307]
MNRLDTSGTLLQPSQQAIHFVRLDQIRPNEQHYPEHALFLADTILRERLWRVPVALERHSLAVMDGHHRLEAARRLKLALVPCLLLDYAQVEVSATRQGYVGTPREIVRRARSGELYPPKTTRHSFQSPPPTCSISLSFLTQAVPEQVPGEHRHP